MLGALPNTLPITWWLRFLTFLLHRVNSAVHHFDLTTHYSAITLTTTPNTCWLIGNYIRNTNSGKTLFPRCLENLYSWLYVSWSCIIHLTVNRERIEHSRFQVWKTQYSCRVWMAAREHNESLIPHTVCSFHVKMGSLWRGLKCSIHFHNPVDAHHFTIYTRVLQFLC